MHDRRVLFRDENPAPACRAATAAHVNRSACAQSHFRGAFARTRLQVAGLGHAGILPYCKQSEEIKSEPNGIESADA